MPDAFGIFIMPPSEDELLRRLRARDRESEELIQKRFNEAKHEIAAAHECGVYDRFIINENLDDAIHDALDSVRGRRTSRHVDQS
jgi:guanylate kinase